MKISLLRRCVAFVRVAAGVGEGSSDQGEDSSVDSVGDGEDGGEGNG